MSMTAMSHQGRRWVVAVIWIAVGVMLIVRGLPYVGLRQVPDVVEMRVRHHHRIESGRIEAETSVDLIGFGAVALEQAAIEEPAALAPLDPVTRSGDGARGAFERDPKRSGHQ